MVRVNPTELLRMTFVTGAPFTATVIEVTSLFAWGLLRSSRRLQVSVSDTLIFEKVSDSAADAEEFLRLTAGSDDATSSAA